MKKFLAVGAAWVLWMGAPEAGAQDLPGAAAEPASPPAAASPPATEDLAVQVAPPPPPPPPQAWAGDFALGFLATGGNTRSRSLNGKAKLAYECEAWKNTLTASAIDAHTVDGNTAESYTAENQTDWHFSSRDYAFLALEWRTDLFATIREHNSASVGYGRHLLVSEFHKLDAELGAGLRQEQTNDEDRRRETALISRGTAHYLWILSPTSSFSQDLKVESGGHNTYVEAVSELKAALVGNLYAGFSYTLKFNTQLADDAHHTDTYTAFNLSYKFGKPS